MGLPRRSKGSRGRQRLRGGEAQNPPGSPAVTVTTRNIHRYHMCPRHVFDDCHPPTFFPGSVLRLSTTVHGMASAAMFRPPTSTRLTADLTLSINRADTRQGSLGAALARMALLRLRSASWSFVVEEVEEQEEQQQQLYATNDDVERS